MERRTGEGTGNGTEKFVMGQPVVLGTPCGTAKPDKAQEIRHNIGLSVSRVYPAEPEWTKVMITCTSFLSVPPQ